MKLITVVYKGQKEYQMYLKNIKSYSFMYKIIFHKYYYVLIFNYKK